MKRSKFISVIPAVLLMAGVSHDASAQQQPTIANMSPVVPTGKKRLVGFYYHLNTDCSVAGDIDARVIKQPENGTLEVAAGTGFSNFPENNQRHACNMKASPGMRVTYVSNDGFVGNDAFDVEFLAGTTDVVWKYNVTVK